MIDIRSLPRKPEEALLQVLRHLIETPRNPSKIELLKQNGNSLYMDLLTATTIGVKAAKRLDDEATSEAIIECLELRDGLTHKQTVEYFERALGLLSTFQVDEHFFDSGEIELFDEAVLGDEEKREIRELLAEARRLTEVASYISDQHKRRIAMRISHVENELYKEKSRTQAFVALVGEVSPLLSKVGDDAKPLAEAVRIARSKAEEATKGQKLIDAEKKPKQITHEK